MLDRIINLLYEIDSLAALTHIHQEDGPLEVAQTYDDVIRHLYWQRHDLDRAILIAQAGIYYCITQADQQGAGEDASKLRSMAKAMAYNLASFCWPGWNEPGITIYPPHLHYGLDAARMNFRLAQELEKGNMPLSYAHWMLGAYGLALRQYGRARADFRAASRYAKAAGNDAERLLAEGYGVVVDLLEVPGDETSLRWLRSVQKALEKVEHGADFINQIETALQVFGASV